ncbi:MAG: 1,4-dihydroxy-2-naphthoate octaprenyltransferase [Flavobacteriales bacterium]|nr:1,4-dihydroxy-2-naphthoate octaprenyltransferase [Flavobacteriales bacterium]
MEKVGIWLSAFRLRTLPLALSSIFMGAAIVSEQPADFALILSLAALTTLFLQILSNLANDYGDYQNGADNHSRIGPARAVQSGEISSQSMFRAMLVFSVLAFISGSSLLYIAFDQEQGLLAAIFLIMGLLAIGAALKYTAGKNPYGYRGLGDISVFVFFGLIGVAGTNFLFTKDFDLIALLPASTIGFLSAAVLNLNNMRDINGDRESGKRTIVVLMGSKKAKVYHYALIFSAWMSLLMFFLLSDLNSWAYLAFIFFPIHLVHLKKVAAVQVPADFDPELKKIALSTFGISFILLLLAVISL